jgi:hypothetical protein
VIVSVTHTPSTRIVRSCDTPDCRGAAEVYGLCIACWEATDDGPAWTTEGSRIISSWAILQRSEEY